MKRIATLLAAIMALCGARGGETDTATVASLDINRFMGLWYEIARYDHRFERNLSDVKAEYRQLPDGRIEVTNSGTDLRTGKRRTAEGKARPGDRPGQLRVSFFLFFYSDYNIMAMADDYSWALVGSDSDKYLWILSRTPTLDSVTLGHILELARNRGYDTSQLLFTGRQR